MTKSNRAASGARALAVAIGLIAAAAAVTPAAAQSIDPATVHVVASPNVLSWPATTRITAIDVESQGMRVAFDKCGAWPPVTPPGWAGPLTHTLWIFMNIGGEWYASGIIQFWDCAKQFNGGPIYQENQIARNWVYGTQWSPMTGRQPAPGERIAFMVSAGNARMQDDHLVAERSDIVEVAMPSGAGFVPFLPSVPPVIPTPPAPPAPPPAPPVVPPPPVPVPSTPTDLGPMLLAQMAAMNAQLAALNAKLDASGAEIHTLKTEVETNWSRYAVPVLKYAAVFAAGILAKMKISPSSIVNLIVPRPRAVEEPKQ